MAGRKLMRVKIEKNDGRLVVTLKGRLDGSGACQVERLLERLHFRCRGSRLVLNLDGVRSFEYFGIASLATSLRSRKKDFQQISLRGLSPATAGVFRRFGIQSTTTEGDHC